jgi:hypothetical protein
MRVFAPHFVGHAVKYPLTFAPLPDQSDRAQAAQVLRDVWLGGGERLDKLADAQIAHPQKRQDVQSRLVRERLVQLRLSGECGFSVVAGARNRASRLLLRHNSHPGLEGYTYMLILNAGASVKSSLRGYSTCFTRSRLSMCLGSVRHDGGAQWRTMRSWTDPCVEIGARDFVSVQIGFVLAQALQDRECTRNQSLVHSTTSSRFRRLLVSASSNAFKKPSGVDTRRWSMPKLFASSAKSGFVKEMCVTAR